MVSVRVLPGPACRCVRTSPEISLPTHSPPLTKWKTHRAQPLEVR